MNAPTTLSQVVKVLSDHHDDTALLIEGDAGVMATLQTVVTPVWQGRVAGGTGDQSPLDLQVDAGQRSPSQKGDVVVLWRPEFAVEQPATLLPLAGKYLRQSGLLILATQLVPGNFLHGKKAERVQTAGQYINAIIGLRLGRAVNAEHIAAWRQQLAAAGFGPVTEHLVDEPRTFSDWAATVSSAADRLRLEAMIVQAPAAAAVQLQATAAGGQLAFVEQFAVFTAVKTT